jgi:hypothetical protein
MPRRRLFNIVALLLYIAWLGAIVGLAFHARGVALETLGTPAAQADWNDWRSAAEDLNDHGPVRRRVPKSTEQPGLVLMRDKFGVVLLAGLLFGSLLYGAVAWPLRGVLTPTDGNRHNDTNDKSSDENPSG